MWVQVGTIFRIISGMALGALRILLVSLAKISFAKLCAVVVAVFLIGIGGARDVALAQSNGPTDNPVYTISNFEVWAEGKDAVAAKKAALADGRSYALSLLMKRLTLYTSYKDLPKVDGKEAAKLITSLSVQNERNSSTEYLANMDFRFSEKGVKALLRQNNISYYDRQGDPLVIVPVVDASLMEAVAGKSKPAMSQADWASSWNTLDLSHGLVPVKVSERLAVIDDAVLSALLREDKAAQEGLSKAYGGKNVVVALLSAAQDEGKVRLTVVGFDEVGEISYKRDHIVTNKKYIQAADVAAEVALGMIEQRLKIVRLRPQVATRQPPAEVLPWQTNTQEAAPVDGWQGDVGGERILMHVEFSGLRHWQSIRQRLTQIQGLEDLNIERLSARDADISCAFPGGAEAFGREVAAAGMRLTPNGQSYELVAN